MHFAEQVPRCRALEVSGRAMPTSAAASGAAEEIVVSRGCGGERGARTDEL